MAYNYREAVKADVKDWIEENGIPEDLGYYETAEEYLNDTLWVEDSVTGNASGSYTFNRAQAEEYVKDNIDLAIEALKEFGYNEHADHIITQEYYGEELDENWEYLDVTIRCYLLGEAIAEAVR